MSVALVRGIHIIGRQSLEPLSAAEERCANLAPPPDLASSPEWHECIEREMQETPFMAALPEVLRAGFAAVVAVAGVALIVAGLRRGGRSAAEEGVAAHGPPR